MEDEQTYFDAQLAKLDTSLRTGDNEMARLHLMRFDLQLSGYVRGEERVVFPVLEQIASGPSSPTAKMRKEHESLRRLVRTMWDALDRADRHRGLQVLGTLRSLLALHVAKEDWILYPLLKRTAH
jgi:iron-sulfur cluster repair protein YtfE (RIC family)